MSKYSTIAVIYGCDSSEWVISCRSGEFTASRIDGSKYDVYEIFARFGHWSLVARRKKNSVREIFPEGERPEIDKTDFSVCIGGQKIKFDYAYIMQHGTPGENGLMQGYLEMLGVPFSSCSSFVSTVTFDKFTCKNYLRNVDYVKCADDVFIRKGEVVPGLKEKVLGRLGLPLFVKPTDGGSSFGVVKVKKEEEFDEAVRTAFSEGKMILAEKFIPGRELTDAVYFNGKEVVALPVIEIVTDHEFFDYDAKYNGCSEEICPARLSDGLTARIQEASKKIYARLGCSGVVRVDYILSGEDLYFLEINTIPGMTSASLVPKMVKAAGMDMTDFLTEIIEGGL
ncbi:MAG: D-alanine--D-alanine ligase [Bacteroidetes bacterium]|uniref:D-alanine--D-alanine ligase n=1 Tax=Candidatus Cryptobacteroides merdigallinarum TaxID=2840770 RepID=A0A9D9EM53_9BACT|nr:D-alanine--D-alanine ligase [Candidatus Cryptobacteroides merdigallinarum]